MGRGMRVASFAALAIFLTLSSGACGKGAPKDDLELIRERWTTNAAPWIAELEQGFAAYDERNAAAAEYYLNDAREKGCGDPLALYRLAVVLEKQGKRDQAYRMLQDIAPDLAASYPKHAVCSEIWLNLGNIEYREEKYEAAFEKYEKALLALDSGAAGSPSDIYYSMGMALRRLERSAEAANWMEKADKSDFRVNYYLADAYYELKKYDLAMQRMRRAVQLEPNSSRALGSLAHFYYALSEREEQDGRFKEAGKAIEQSVLLYRRAIEAGGDIYQDYLKSAEWRVQSIERLKAAAEQGLLNRENIEGGPPGDPGMAPPDLPEMGEYGQP